MLFLDGILLMQMYVVSTNGITATEAASSTGGFTFQFYVENVL
jgi:hypothetical protein